MMTNGTVSQESATRAETDDEVIYFTPNRQRIIRAGKCARLEQERLERQLRDSRMRGAD
jgi:hypothetical protein